MASDTPRSGHCESGRGGEYAAAAKKRAPQARQIADRFHLLKNLRERLKDVMDRKQSCLPEIEEQASDAIPAKAQGIKGTSVHEPCEPQTQAEPEKHYRTIPPYPYQRPDGMNYEEERQLHYQKHTNAWLSIFTK